MAPLPEAARDQEQPPDLVGPRIEQPGRPLTPGDPRTFPDPFIYGRSVEGEIEDEDTIPEAVGRDTTVKNLGPGFGRTDERAGQVHSPGRDSDHVVKNAQRSHINQSNERGTFNAPTSSNTTPAKPGNTFGTGGTPLRDVNRK